MAKLQQVLALPAIGLLLTLIGPTPTHAAALFPALSLDPGGAPRSIAVGDVDLDGAPDVAVVVAGSSSVALLRNHGDGTFAAPVMIPVGVEPSAVVIADVNRDSRPDLVTVNRSSNSVSVLLGDGTGSFGAASNFATGNQPVAVVVVDVNSDGRRDLVVANAGDGTFSVLLRTAAGSYAAKVDYPCVVHPVALAVADVSGDGRPDVAVASDSVASAALAINQGAGVFGAPSALDAGGRQSAVALADLNGDGKFDLITAEPDPLQHSVAVFRNLGAGAFGSRSEFPVGSDPRAVIAVDVTGDGKLDLVTADAGDGGVSLLASKGDGSFLAAQSLGAGPGALDVRSADVNLDGHADLVVADAGSARVSVLLGYAGGGIGRIDLATAPVLDLALASMNGDAWLDLVTLEQTCGDTCSGGIAVHLGTGHGSFAPATPVAVRRAGGGALRLDVLGVADFDQDGRSDVVCATHDGDLVTLLGDGAGGFRSQVATHAGGTLAPIVVGDFNQDGRTDLVAGDRVWLGKGDGTFVQGSTLPAAGWTLARRLDGDRFLDLVRVVPGMSQIEVALGDSSGGFRTPVAYGTGAVPNAVAAGFLNGDHVVDLVTANTDAGTISVLAGVGDGSFGPPVQFPTAAAPRALTVADVDVDQRQDVVTCGSAVSVLPGDGNAGLGAPVEYDPSPGPGLAPAIVVAGDLDLDHKPELTCTLDAGFTVLHNLRSGTVIAVGTPVVSPRIVLAIRPNPARGQAIIAFTLPSPAQVAVDVLDLAGRRVARVYDGLASAGWHEFKWPARLADGIYLVRVVALGGSVTRKLVWMDRTR